ncbi:MAG: hypothetical protein AB1925_12455 [Actinomycetota bacterium]
MAFDRWKVTSTTRLKLVTGQFDLDNDAFKVALFASTSNLGTASTTFASVTNELPAANGYTPGGVAVTLDITGTDLLSVAFATNPKWTATGGSLVANKAALYKVGGDVLAWLQLDDTGIDLITTVGNELELDNDGTPYPVLTLG